MLFLKRKFLSFSCSKMPHYTNFKVSAVAANVFQNDCKVYFFKSLRFCSSIFIRLWIWGFYFVYFSYYCYNFVSACTLLLYGKCFTNKVWLISVFYCYYQFKTHIWWHKRVISLLSQTLTLSGFFNPLINCIINPASWIESCILLFHCNKHWTNQDWAERDHEQKGSSQISKWQQKKIGLS